MEAQDYKKLVDALRSASTVSTAWEKLMRDAAAAIEALLKENKELIEDHPEMVEADGHWEWRKPNGEVQLPKRGEWIYLYDGNYKCSVCGAWYGVDETPVKSGMNYCPNCGAKMDGEVEHE